MIRTPMSHLVFLLKFSFFHLAWRQFFQCPIRSFGIIKLNIGSDTGLKCAIGNNILSVKLFFFNDAKNDSATALSCGSPGYEKTVLHCAHVRASGTDEMYIACLDHHENQVRLEDFAPHKPS